MNLITISKELNLAEADLKVSQLTAAGFHPVLQDESCALYVGMAIGVGGFRLQVPEDQVAAVQEFLASPVTPIE